MHPIALARRAFAAGARHRWRALALAWAVCLVGWAVVIKIPNQYAATTRVYADADAILGLLLRGIAIDSSPAGQVEILQRTLLSRPNLEKIVSRTELEQRVTDELSREKLMANLARDIRITTQTRNLFTIDFRDRNPSVAQDVVQTALNLFMEAATLTDRQQMENARTFVNQQIASYEVQLRQAERRRAEFQTRYIDILPSDALGGVTRLEAARARLQQVRGELQDQRRRLELTRQQLDAMPAATAATGGGGGGNSRLAEAERALSELRLRYTDAHPDVVAARSIVNGLRASGGGGGAARSGPAAPREAARSNPAYEQMRLRLVDVETQIASLERQEREGREEVTRLDTVTRSEPEVQAQFLNLDRDYTVLRRNYEELLARRESLQLGGAARSSSDRVRLEVVDPPSVAAEPVAPNRPLLAAGVLALGLGAGLALAFVLMQFDRTFYTVQDLRRLGPAVLGALSAPPRRGVLAGRLGFASGLAMLLLVFGVVVVGGPSQLARFFA
ncbi:XrtA system polysaccharide chain length determinant [Roseococcus sp.]|uniref:XrtA system polysaccharide chain length determinant n=1 Tax=Roseococcus sp. TaxID=2109646 RepID=UPI003BAC9C8F